jgi:hypothetical protein
MGIARQLSHTLLDAGCFSALGTTEREGLSGRQTVGRRTPLTYDFNNGVGVIYDENGWPWIFRSSQLDEVKGGGLNMAQIIAAIVADFPLMHGAYVPHSNDGGYFIRVVVPALLGGTPHTETHQEKVDEVVRQMNIRTFGNDKPVRSHI